MIYFTRDDGTKIVGHVTLHMVPHSIILVRADGDELEKCFEILPFLRSNRRVVTFTGNFARMIAMNWEEFHA